MTEFHTVDLNNIQLHYAEAPGPGLPLVILHGLSGSHAEFLHLVPELADQAHVYLLDLRGHGLSGQTTGMYQLADYGQDVVAFLRQVVGQPAVVVGHSLGGIVAIWLASNEPHLLRGIFLEDPGFYIMQMPRFGQSVFYPYFVDLFNYLQQYHSNGASLEAMIAYVGRTPVVEEQTWLDVAGPEAVRERAIQLHQLDPAVLDPALAGMLLNGYEPDHLLAQIRCPVHLVAAQVALTIQDVERATLQVPHCTHAIIENTGHDIHLDQPEAFMQALKWFLTAI
jgi:pimeloyl-ACP methyl ester carboxylesterase